MATREEHKNIWKLNIFTFVFTLDLESNAMEVLKNFNNIMESWAITILKWNNDYTAGPNTIVMFVEAV